MAYGCGGGANLGCGFGFAGIVVSYWQLGGCFFGLFFWFTGSRNVCIVNSGIIVGIIIKLTE